MGRILFPLSINKMKSFGTDASCCMVREVTLTNKNLLKKWEKLHLVPRFSASRQWMPFIPLLSAAGSSLLLLLKGWLMDESQVQRRCSGLQNHSPEEISQEQNCCSSQAERGWESDSLQMGRGTFLLKKPENHWGGTNPSRMTAEMSQENGLSLGSKANITKHFIRKWTVFGGLISEQKVL